MADEVKNTWDDEIILRTQQADILKRLNEIAMAKIAHEADWGFNEAHLHEEVEEDVIAHFVEVWNKQHPRIKAVTYVLDKTLIQFKWEI